MPLLKEIPQNNAEVRLAGDCISCFSCFPQNIGHMTLREAFILANRLGSSPSRQSGHTAPEARE